MPAYRALALGVGLVFFASGSLAQALPPPDKPQYSPATPPSAAEKDGPPPLFVSLDTNRDGFVSRDEAKRSAEATARFDELDANRDGRITAIEFRKIMEVK